jgi:hypothetical protein
MNFKYKRKFKNGVITYLEEFSLYNFSLILADIINMAGRRGGNFKVSNIKMHNKFTLDVVRNTWASHRKKVGPKEHALVVLQLCYWHEASVQDTKLSQSG